MDPFLIVNRESFRIAQIAAFNWNEYSLASMSITTDENFLLREPNTYQRAFYEAECSLDEERVERE